MKNKIKYLVMLIALLIGAGVTQLASAKKLGDGLSIGGVNLGWVLILGFAILAVGVLALKSFKVIGGKPTAIIGVIAIVAILIGCCLAFVDVETTTTATTTGGCPEWTIKATAITTGTDYITTANWNKDERTFTIPLTVGDSSDGNLTGAITALNFTLDPISTSQYKADNMATIHYKSDYNIKYGGEEIFDKTGNYFDVNWTDPTGTESYDGVQDMQMSETSWALCTWEFNNGTAGNWVTELDAIGDSVTWYVYFTDDCGNTVFKATCIAMVVSYTE